MLTIFLLTAASTQFDREKELERTMPHFKNAQNKLFAFANFVLEFSGF